MKRLKKIFSFVGAEKKETSGLYASLDELLDLRKNTRYLQALTKHKTSNQVGDVRSAFKGRGIELEEVRAYAFGDDVRDIDWRVSARKLNPYTRLYVEEKDREVYVLLDLSASMVFGTKKELKSVSAAKVAALLGWLALEKKDRFGCVIFDGKNNHIFKPQNSAESLIAVLKKISDVSQEVLQTKTSSESLAKSIQLLENKTKGHSLIFIISDFAEFDDGLRKKIAALAKKSQLYLLNVFDVLEDVAPKSGEYMAQNGMQRLIFDTKSKDFQNEYGRYFHEKREKIKDFGQKFDCKYMEIRTDMELVKQIKFYKKT